MTKLSSALLVLLLTSCSSDESPIARKQIAPMETSEQALPKIVLWGEAATAPVGGSVVLTAEITDSAGEPIPDDTLVTFQLTGAAGVLTNAIAKAKAGIVKSTVTGLAPGFVTATARLDPVVSNTVTIGYLAPVTTSGVLGSATSTSVLVTEAGEGGVRVRVRAVDQKGNPVSGVTIPLTTTAGTFSGPAVTGYDGWAMVILSVASWECPLTITALSPYSIVFEIVPAYVDLSVERMGNEVLGVTGSGFPEFVNFKIRLTHPDGSLYQIPTQINVWIEPTSLASLAWYGACCVGEVMATVHTGRSAGMASLWVEAPELGLRRSIEFLIEGGLPTAQSFSLTSEKRTVSALRKSGILVNLYAAATDRWGNATLKNRPVFVSCESGTCLSPVAGGADRFGRAMFTIDTTPNERLAQFSGLVAAAFPVPFSHNWPLLGDRRNGWLTVLAGAIGESTFVDADGDGVFSLGDTVVFDPPEPYLDRDESGTFGSGETFWDFDGNLVWSAHEVPAFHARQYVWSSYTLVLSGRPAIYIVPSRFLDCDADQSFTPGIDFFAVGVAISTPFPCAVYPPGASPAATDVFVHFADENGNQLPAASELSVELFPDTGVAMGSNSLQATRYDGSETKPYDPVRYRINDSSMATGELTQATFCAQVVLGDTTESFVQCIDGYTY